MNPSEAPLSVPPIADEALKRSRLEQMKRRATGLLVLMTGVFIVSRLLEPAHPWIAYVRATAEAAMVGGVADWFAITALFRHPLGIRIPHTAIIPQRKDRIGRSLGNFVQNNFLSNEILGAKLRAAQLSRRAAEWLSRPENGQAVARHAATALQNASAMMRDEDVHAFLDRTIIEPVRRRPIAPMLARGLEILTIDDRHQQLLDRLVRGVSGLVTSNEELIRQRIREESPWWVPDFVDDKVHDKVVTAIERTLRDVVNDPSHPLRRQFDELVLDWIVRLQESPELIEKAETVKQQLLDSPASRELSASLWESVKRALDRQAAAASDGAPGGVAKGLSALANAALADEGLLEKIDGWIVGAVLAVVEQHRGEVGQLIAGTVARWDPDETSQRIELQVGRDLQFVRINGTLVGGLVGLLLFTLSRLLERGGL